MFLIFQVPFADLRKVGIGAAERMPKPDWSATTPTGFIRNFGEMRRRNQSVKGVQGEQVFVTIDNAITFPPDFSYAEPSWGGSVYSRPWYRRLYFDGVISGRFEIGFWIDTGDARSAGVRNDLAFDVQAFVASVLSTIISVNVPDGRVESVRLVRSGQYLAEAYVIASTSNAGLLSTDLPAVLSATFQVGKPNIYLRFAAGTTFSPTRSLAKLSDKFGAEHLITDVRAGSEKVNCLVVQSPGDDPFFEFAEERAARIIFAHLRTLAFAAGALSRNTSSDREPIHRAVIELLPRLKQYGADTKDGAKAGLSLFSTANEGQIRHLTSLIEALSHKLERPSFFKKAGDFVDKSYEIALKQAVDTTIKYQLKGGGP